MEQSDFSQGLSSIRRKRWALWSVLLTYLPATWTTLETTNSMKATGVVFGIWVLLASITSSVAAFARCPRCGNYWHVKGLTPVWVRKCLYCKLHLCADKKR